MRSAFFTVLLLFGVLKCAVAADTAMLFFVSGAVETKVQSGGWKPARSLQRLNAQDQVRCSAGGRAGIVIFATGERFKVSSDAIATVQDGTVSGAKSLGQIGGLSARAAGQLAGSRSGAIGSRGLIEPQDLVDKFPGWLPAGTRTFSWADKARFQFTASEYCFTLFDLSGSVVWSERTTKREAKVPTNVPDFNTNEPYIWRLNGISRTGKASRTYVWGFVTFLTPDEGAKLDAAAMGLQRTLASVNSAKPTGAEEKSAQETDKRYYTALIADLYRQQGVLMGAFDTWFQQYGLRESNDSAADAGGLARLFLGMDSSVEGN